MRLTVRIGIGAMIFVAFAAITWAISSNGLQAHPLNELNPPDTVAVSQVENGFLTGPDAGSPQSIASAYLTDNRVAIGLSQEDLAETAVSETYTRKSDFTQVEFTQRLNGIEVYNGMILVNVAADGSIINMHNQFVPDLTSKTNAASPVLTSENAVNAAAEYLGLSTVNLTTEKTAGNAAQETTFNDGGISRRAIPAKLVYQPMEKDVRLAWSVDIYMIDEDNWWNMRIDAVTGKLLDQFNYVIHEDFIEQAQLSHGDAYLNGVQHDLPGSFNFPPRTTLANTYNVFGWPVESPNHATPPNPADGRTIESNPSADASALGSPFGWHSDNATSWTTTQGNNVGAQKNGVYTDCGAGLDCNHVLDLTIDPTAGTNLDVARDNLFYWNNITHDVWYNYGFDEASRNFQQNNNGQGGAGNDRVIANAQASGNCNANFGTPPDGSQPTMNMFNCDIATPTRDGDLDNGVVVHEYTHGISNRLTGGTSVSCLENSEQMGEGWSDWYGLMVTIEAGDAGIDERGIGTWLLGTGPNGPGVRNQKYTTDMAVNTHTYGDLPGMVVPHGVGEVWATMIWDMTWALIADGNQSGLDLDIYNGTGGNNLAMQLVTDGMKLQPCSPGFVDGRDAILLADQNLTGGANQCVIWEVFARRGLGFSASQGSSGSASDGTEAFDMPASCNFIAPQPTSLDVCVGTDAVYDVDVNAAFVAPVTMSAAGEPAGSSIAFSVNPVIGPLPQTISMTVSSIAAPAVGSHTITITGTDSSGSPVSESATVGLTVFPDTIAAPALAMPADGATNVHNSPTLSWSAVAGAGSYIVEVDDDPGFGSIDYSVVEVGTSHNITISLDALTTYYWRVESSNMCGAGVTSAVWSFTTRDIPPILLVDDDDNSPDVLSYYTNALDALGAQYDIWDTGNSDNEPSAAELAPYSTVIWFTGDEWGGAAGPGATGEADLATWLDDGNCLFITSQDYYYDRNQTAFMTDYLGLSSATSDTSVDASVTGQGIVFSGYGPYTVDYGPIGSDWSDTFVAAATAEIAFQDNTGKDIAVSKEDVYRTTFWGYSYEAIASAADREEAMGVVLNWCGSGTAAGTLDGTVTDVDSGLAIEGATVTAGSRSAATDVNGDYSMTVAVGSYDVTVEATNYFSETVTAVSIITDTTSIVDFTLDWAQPIVTVDYAAVEVSMLLSRTMTTTLTIMNDGPVVTSFDLVEIPGGYTMPPLFAATDTSGTIGNSELASETVGRERIGEIGTPSVIAMHSHPFVPTLLLYDNGSLITHPGGGASGLDASAVQTNLSMTSYGAGHQFSVGNRIADDFVVDTTWTVDAITFFAYQTGSGLPSTITGVYLQIWDGPPNDPGSSVIFGDTTTNRLTNTAFSDIYRVLDTGLTNSDRPIMANTAAVGITLPPGTYWLDWMTDGSGGSGPWAPAVSVLGSTGSGNALQWTGSWAGITDVGPQDFPFIIEGTAGEIAWLSEDPITGTVDADGSTLVNLIFDSTVVTQTGTYSGTLRVMSDDPLNGVIQIPITMHVVTDFNIYLPAIMKP